MDTGDPDDPYRAFAQYFLDDFESVVGLEEPLNIGQFALVDRAVIAGSDEDKLERIPELLDESLELRPGLSQVQFPIKRLYGRYCQVSARHGRVDFAMRLLEAGKVSEDCVASIVQAISDKGNDGTREMQALLVEYPDSAPIRKAAVPFLVGRAAVLEQEDFESELQQYGLDGWSPAVRAEVTLAVLPTIVPKWKQGEVLKFVDPVAGEFSFSEDEVDEVGVGGAWRKRFGRTVFDLVRNKRQGHALELLAHTSGFEPELVDVAFAARFNAADSDSLDFYTPTLDFNNVPDALKLVEDINATFRDVAPDQKASQRLATWVIGRNSSIATRAYSGLVSIISEDHSPSKGRELVTAYASLRSSLPSETTRQWLDQAVGQEVFRKLSDEAVTSAGNWQQEDAERNIAIAEKLMEFLVLDEEEVELFSSAQEEVSARAAMKCDDLIAAGSERRIRAPLELCLSRAANSDEKGRALYLLASIARQARDYQASERYMERFIREIPRHDLLDDTFAELGWLAFRNKDYKRAEQMLKTVTQRVPDSNAADNALYWLGKMAEARKSDELAASYYSAVVVNEGADRLRSVVWREHAASARYIQDFDRVMRWSEDLVVKELPQDDDLRPIFLQTGDKVVQFCGKSVADMRDVLKVMDSLPKRERTCDVTVLRMLAEGEEVERSRELRLFKP